MKVIAPLFVMRIDVWELFVITVLHETRVHVAFAKMVVFTSADNQLSHFQRKLFRILLLVVGEVCCTPAALLAELPSI